MKELNKRLINAKNTLQNDIKQWSTDVMGLTALAMLSKRVRRKGGAPDGGSYKPYSTKPILVGAKSFTKQGQNLFKKSGESTKKGGGSRTVFERKNKDKNQWVTITRNGTHYHLILLPGGYKEIRRIEGRQTGHKDFERTGEMWKSLGVNKDRVTKEAIKTVGLGPGIFMTEIGTSNERTNKILEGNVKREGKEIMELTKQEEVILDRIFNAYITNKVNFILNG